MWSVRGTNIHRFQAFHHLDWHKVSNSSNFCPSWCSTFIDQLLHLFEIVNQTRNVVSSCCILYRTNSSLQRLQYWCFLPLMSLLPSSCPPQIPAYVLFMPAKEAETVSTYLWSFLRAHWPGMASWIWGQLRNDERRNCRRFAALRLRDDRRSQRASEVSHWDQRPQHLRSPPPLLPQKWFD